MFNWNKKGLLFKSNIKNFTHGSHPCAIHIENDDFIIAFTCRDKLQKSHIFLTHAKVYNGCISLTGTPKLSLYPGAPGYFDCDGVISGCLIKNHNTFYLYYVGWQNLPDSLWICDTGRAILDINNLTLKKEFSGPVLGRDKNHPLFAAATAFFITEDNVWHTWYNSGISWEKRESVWHHYYGLHYAYSLDGINWNCNLKQCLPFKDKYEYAFGRPTVVRWNNTYHMWFAHRATKLISTYRIGYASSLDGINWLRDDSKSGIDVSDNGWDSEMICYPCVFEHNSHKYMLYNGNHYGETGFGYAVLN